MLITVNNALTDYSDVLKSVAHWIDQDVSKPSMNSDRTKPMCPRSRVAVDNNLIYLCLRPSLGLNMASYENEINKLESIFLNSLHEESNNSDFFSILFCYESVNLPLFEESCRKSKQKFLEHKMLLGKFHPEIQLHSLDDNNYWFKSTPFPILALRKLIPEDVRFLENYRNEEDRDKLIDSYNKVFTNT